MTKPIPDTYSVSLTIDPMFYEEAKPLIKQMAQDLYNSWEPDTRNLLSFGMSDISEITISKKFLEMFDKKVQSLYPNCGAFWDKTQRTHVENELNRLTRQAMIQIHRDSKTPVIC